MLSFKIALVLEDRSTTNFVGLDLGFKRCRYKSTSGTENRGNGSVLTELTFSATLYFKISFITTHLIIHVKISLFIHNNTFQTDTLIVLHYALELALLYGCLAFTSALK